MAKEIKLKPVQETKQEPQEVTQGAPAPAIPSFCMTDEGLNNIVQCIEAIVPNVYVKQTLFNSLNENLLRLKMQSNEG
jgi:hypothetical protein